MDSTTMSAVVGAASALAGAAVGGVVTWAVYVRTKKEQRLRDFREVMLQIHDHRIREMTDLDQISDSDQGRLLRVTFGARLSTLRSIAESLVSSVASKLTFQDLLVLGAELQQAAEYAKAHAYFQRAVAVTESAGEVDHVIALRHLAGLYFVRASQTYDPTLGDRTYQRAVEVTRGSEDPWLIFTTAWTYSAWASCQVGEGDDRWRATALEARRYYTVLPPTYPYRNSELQSLDQWIAAADAAWATGARVEPPMAADPFNADPFNADPFNSAP